MSNNLKNAIIDSMNNVLESINCDPWMLDPGITYLNHGSFGARSLPVFEYQAELKRVFEASPVDFLDRQTELLVSARTTVSSFLGADVDGFGFVDNATTGIGCVLQSISFEKDDEILTSNLVYNGVRQLLKRVASDARCLYTECEIELPVKNQESILEVFFNAISRKTKLVVIDHVSSSSAIVFPVQEIIALCKEKGVLVVVDGAHAPGMLNLNIDELDADWYVGNLHKWVCAPIGAGFVYASPPQREKTHPMTVSHWYGQGFTQEFDWQGSKDISPWLASAKAVEWGAAIDWSKIRFHNHALATRMQHCLVESWGVEPLSPLNGSMIGSMATVPLPDSCPQTMAECSQLQDQLFTQYKIEVPVFELQGRGYLRVSAQLYSREDHVKQLQMAISQIIA
ncbi:MAG: hypothetical protein CMJ26_05910 [Phycisphaerae bacterium]|nr:hypothetical protein [Phycisphaerae bacterium]|tara:strand:+ start:997 stop:2190 length:1194 start_codon:yes stop_codon:yes gene_type:complete